MTGWTDPAFIASARAWAEERCADRGVRVTGALDQFHVRAWSTVFRVPTTAGALYLKCCGASQAHEPRLTELLTGLDPALLPEVVARHPERPWMLVADAGAKLRDAATGDGVLDAWCDVLPRYARLQERAAPMVDRIEALDTPDHRLATLRAWLGSVIDDAQVIRLDEGEGLTSAERSRLRKALPRVGALCDELAGLGVPETVQHDDLHDGNVLVRDGRAVIFDWGDACIAHPLLTLAITLPFAAWRASLPEDAPQVDRIRDAYLEHWTTRASPDRLRRAVPAAITVGWISRALTWHAVVTHFEAELEEAERYPVARSLRRVLELLG